MGVAISARGVGFDYRTGGSAVAVLHDLDLELGEAAYLSLMGASGAGKSTLLGLLGGLIPPQRGSLEVAGQQLAGLRGDELAAYRRAVVGFIFQTFGLVDVLTARENVEVALALSGVARRGRAMRAEVALRSVGLAHRSDHRPGQLSGGERQRVAIARALVNSPRLILADEPTGNLDETTSGEILDLMERVRHEQGCTLVVVTHNSAVAGRAGERLALREGRLVPR